MKRIIERIVLTALMGATIVPVLASQDHSAHDPAQRSAPASGDATAVEADHAAHESVSGAQPAHSHADAMATPAHTGGHEQQSEPMGTSHDMMGHDMMGHDQMQETEPLTLRDPHAYSNGYGLTTGPYALPSQPELRLADDKNFSGLWMDRLEYMDAKAGNSIELEGHAWWGNSYRRVLLQTEAEVVDDRLEEGELSLAYSRAVTAFWNLEFGARREFNEQADRDWLKLGINGLAPHWFEIDASVYLGEGGQSAFELEAEYDLYLSQRLILQPRIELTAYGDDDIELGRGSGLSSTSIGSRLRYELKRQFAPYLGVEYTSRFGNTADFLTPGMDKSETRWVLGVRFWF